MFVLFFWSPTDPGRVHGGDSSKAAAEWLWLILLGRCHRQVRAPVLWSLCHTPQPACLAGERSQGHADWRKHSPDGNQLLAALLPLALLCWWLMGCCFKKFTLLVEAAAGEKTSVISILRAWRHVGLKQRWKDHRGGGCRSRGWATTATADTFQAVPLDLFGLQQP